MGGPYHLGTCMDHAWEQGFSQGNPGSVLLHCREMRGRQNKMGLSPLESRGHPQPTWMGPKDLCSRLVWLPSTLHWRASPAPTHMLQAPRLQTLAGFVPVTRDAWYHSILSPLTWWGMKYGGL